MNTQITSAEEILKAAQKILLEHGASALNMRAVAAACGVSVGSIYNYFPSKSALIGATIESVWTEIFRPFTSRCYTSFDDAATALLAALTDGEGRYPGIFFAARAFLRQRRQSRRACAHGAAFQRPAWKIGGSAGKRHAHPRRRFRRRPVARELCALRDVAGHFSADPSRRQQRRALGDDPQLYLLKRTRPSGFILNETEQSSASAAERTFDT